MKKQYRIKLMGCDDTTTMYLKLSNSERDFLAFLSEISEKTSTYGCMPTMEIEETEDVRPDDVVIHEFNKR